MKKWIRRSITALIIVIITLAFNIGVYSWISSGDVSQKTIDAGLDDSNLLIAMSGVSDSNLGLGVFVDSGVPSAPTDVSATDGSYTDKVTITWTKVGGATGYKVYEGDNLLDTLGDVATYDDTAAPAPTITAGSTVATDGSHTDYVGLSLSGTSANNGTSRTYKVVAYNDNGDGAASDTDTGYRGVGSLTYQWQKSSGDADSGYSNISGATSSTYNDGDAPEDGSGLYYKCILNATGATQQTSTADRGYLMTFSDSFANVITWLIPIAIIFLLIIYIKKANNPKYIIRGIVIAFVIFIVLELLTNVFMDILY